MITDGFDKVEAMRDMSDAVLIGSHKVAGVRIDVYIQECRGLINDGVYGQFHIAMDIIDVAKGAVIDTIALDTFKNISEDEVTYRGHFTKDQTETAFAELVADFEDAKTRTIAEFGSIEEDKWVATFYEIAKKRRFQRELMKALMEMISGDDEDEDEDEDEKSETEFRSKLEKLLGDFDPDKVEPTDEGLDS